MAPVDLVIELERGDAEEQPAGSVAREASMALQASGTVLEVAAKAARWIRSLTEFDRVMVYRFDADWNGEVIAEHKRDGLNTFLGLHYPSTNIPAQARKLYRRNWLRAIPDIAYRPVTLFPAVAYESERPLDLSASTLRSVSPIYIEYLTNMGVGASMSVSIVINGALWGLIACHHYSGPDLCSMAALVERRMTRSTTRQSRQKHDLSDSHATAALAAGVPVKVVSQQVGHGPRRRHIEGLHRTSCPDDEDAALRADSLLAP